MNILAQFKGLSIDWTNFEEASHITQDIAQELANNSASLRELALSVGKDESLFALAEKHDELNYIVLYNNLERGLRIRLHRFSKGKEDIPHNHRFSFSSAIVAGSYVHTLYRLISSESDTSADRNWALNQPPGTYVGVGLKDISVSDLTPLLITTQTPGSSYSLHYDTIHKTAMPLEDAFSVFVRGPAQKTCALQLEPQKRTYRWKFGREYEETKVLNNRSMSKKEYTKFIESLEEAGVI